MLESINPYTQELNGKFDLLDENGIDEVINLANDAYLKWRYVSTYDKKQLFLNLACVLEKDIDECARLQTIEMGMLYSLSREGIIGTVNLIKWFANNFESIIGEKEFETTEGVKGKEMYDSIGVIFGVAPWNFPFNQLLRAAVPNILAGNTQVYKHSSNVPMCALKIQELFDEAGFEKGIFNNVFVSSRLSEYIISNKLIRGVNLTGSEMAGSAVGSLAGKYLKPSVLELGGNDAFVLCNTNDVKPFAQKAALIKIKNGGQTCNNSKRFIILEEHYDEFCEVFTDTIKNFKLGDPFDKNTDLQPMSSLKSIVEMEKQVIKATDSGAKLLTGGKRASIAGYFMTPTVLCDVTPETSSYNEEIFGPVASIMKSRNLEHSVKLANGTDFGLSACVFGDDKQELLEIAKKLEGGMIFMNSGAGSKASLPFGGVKKSGYGKENGPDGLKAFTNKKVIIY